MRYLMAAILAMSAPAWAQTAVQERWTVESSREDLLTLIEANDRRYEQRFDASQKALDLGLSAQKAAVDAALAAAERAVAKAELASEKRFDSVNEFRSTLADQQRTLMPRSEAEAVLGAMNDKVAGLQKHMDDLNSERKGIQGGWGYAVGVIGFIMSIGALMTWVMGTFRRTSRRSDS